MSAPAPFASLALRKRRNTDRVIDLGARDDAPTVRGSRYAYTVSRIVVFTSDLLHCAVGLPRPEEHGTQFGRGSCAGTGQAARAARHGGGAERGRAAGPVAGIGARAGGARLAAAALRPLTHSGRTPALRLATTARTRPPGGLTPRAGSPPLAPPSDRYRPALRPPPPPLRACTRM
ncbi:hypothetical protein O0L34_g5775 [Tuta absoluta]|nr:hypothetical protein O0L34_g5775 [Tuta absoluta]